MLTPPPIPDTLILARAAEEFGLPFTQVTFLPLGADVNTAVYRAATAAGAVYFLKLRQHTFNPITVELAQFLHAQGIGSIIPPLPARSGRLWADLPPFALILYPYIPGVDGYTQNLTPTQWQAFGADLARVHAAGVPTGLLPSGLLPAHLAARIPREDFSPRFRDRVRAYLIRAVNEPFADPVGARLAAFLSERRDLITHMIDRAAALAGFLQLRRVPFVLCHSDIHAGNLHLTPSGALYLVDWDAPIFAPKERDLLLIGGARPWDSPSAAALFYSAYAPQRGPACLDPQALAYYRYTRILEDIADFCAQLLDAAAGGPDREQSFTYCTGLFSPNCEVDVALQSDAHSPT